MASGSVKGHSSCGRGEASPGDGDSFSICEASSLSTSGFSTTPPKQKKSSGSTPSAKGSQETPRCLKEPAQPELGELSDVLLKKKWGKSRVYEPQTKFCGANRHVEFGEMWVDVVRSPLRVHAQISWRARVRSASHASRHT